MNNTKNKTENEINNPLEVLKHKNFKIYWISMCISLIGTWMQNIAQPWLAYTLTNSPFLLGLIGAMQFTPMLLFSLFAGVFIDKYNKKRIIIFTQSASLVVTLILAVLVWSSQIQYWHILVMATLLGVVNTLDMPARQAFIIELVGKEDLMNAIALNSSVFHVARIIGPALAGLAMAYVGAYLCFFINSFSFAAVVIALLFVKANKTEKLEKMGGNVIEEIKDGLKYVYERKVLFKTMLATAIVATFAMNNNVLLPVLTRTVLGHGEKGFGILMSLSGAGSFIGAMSVASNSKHGPKKFNIIVAPIFIAGLLVATGFSNGFILIGILIATAGLFFVSFNSTANSTVQMNTKDEYRGRVMSVYVLVFGGLSPIGSLYSGIITQKYGPKWGFVACGTMILVLLSLLNLFVKIDKTDKIENNNA